MKVPTKKVFRGKCTKGDAMLTKKFGTYKKHVSHLHLNCTGRAQVENQRCDAKKKHVVEKIVSLLVNCLSPLLQTSAKVPEKRIFV